MRIAGVDPGLRGAVAVIDTESGGVEIHDIPSLQVGYGQRREYHDQALADLFRALRLDYAVIERQQARPENPATAFKVGLGYGLIRGILTALGVPFVVVSPQFWQRPFLHGETRVGKDWSIMVCSRLYPNVKLARHDHADALLLATYGKGMIEKGGPAWSEV